VRSLGWPFATLEGYEALRASLPGLPSAHRLVALTRRDVVAISQWEAPAEVIGAPFERPELRRSVVLAAEDDVNELFAALAECLAAWAISEVPVILEHVGRAPEIFLDVPRAPPWRPLANVDGWCLRVEPGLVARADK
jgi:hypothetical protein